MKICHLFQRLKDTECAGEEEEVEVTRFCRNFGLRRKGERNQRGRISEVE